MGTHMSTHMASINISIKKEAYAFLKSRRTKDESFSDVILSFKEQKGNKDTIMKYFGALSSQNIDWTEKEKRMKRLRESVNKRMSSIRSKMASK